jgi:Tfp pilus assembly protein PilZ
VFAVDDLTRGTARRLLAPHGLWGLSSAQLGLVRRAVPGFHSLQSIMPHVRRAARRVRLPGVQVTYESATGERQQARLVDLSREGLYIPTAKPLAVGKRLALEIQPIGEATAWLALGRVVWARDANDGDERPAGMAVKIIDAEDAVVEAIERLLEAREPTDRGLGAGDTILPVRPRARSNPPAREKAMPDVGTDAAPPPAAPIVLAVSGREAGVLEGERPEERAARRPSVEVPARRRSAAGLSLFVLVVAGGVAGYAFRTRIVAFSHVAAAAIRTPR